MRLQCALPAEPTVVHRSLSRIYGAKTWCRTKQSALMRGRWAPALLAYCVLASSPENDLFVLGMGWNEVSNLFSFRRQPHCLRVTTNPWTATGHSLTCLPISTSIAPDRWEGLCSHRPLGVLRQFSRGLPLTLVAHIRFARRLQGMNLVSYYCSISAISIIISQLSINIIS